MSWFIPWVLWAVVGPLLAYRLGRAIGAERMRTSILRHPVVRAHHQNIRNQLRRTA